jgi:Zn-dependent protease/CBS domain-containing protein
MGTLKVGRIAGIDILIHWSWLAIFALLTWWLATGFYGEVDRYDHWSGAERWVAAAVTTVLFFLSVLLHELSHSLTAKRFGLPVASITLFIFGGVSSLTEEPANAKQEFIVAIVGPGTSFLLGIIAGIIAVVCYMQDAEDTLVGAIAEYLAIINVAVGIFNMLPGYPLDGGRVLRSVLWARSRNMLKATRWASSAGSFISFGLIALGVISMLAGNFVGGAWFVVIGWFLRNQSEQAYQQLVLKNTLEGATVSEMVNRGYESAAPDVPLADIVHEYMIGRGQRFVPIVVAGDLLGVVTMTDLQKVPRDQWPATSAYRAMTPHEKLHIVEPQDSLTRALELMAEHDVHQLPVVNRQRDFLGFVTRSDVLRLIQIRTEVGSASG